VEEDGVVRRPQQNIIMRLVTKLVDFVGRLLKKIASFLFSNRYHLDDIIMIVRPFIFVYSVMQYGHKSFTPVKISLILDFI
jgi:VanZ family protein